jgi:hypothetical protein
MRKLIFTATLLAPALLGGTAIAQDETAPATYAYATYFVCSPDGESRADEIIKSSFKPHYDAAVEQGDILSWSWLQHLRTTSGARCRTLAAARRPTLAGRPVSRSICSAI